MPSTEKQIEANRANALHSTGPTSEAGKARSSRNALRHGLTAQDLYVPAGQEDEFEAFKEDLRTSLWPEGPVQYLLFNNILEASWKLLRCSRTEAALASRTSEPGLDPLLDPTLAGVLKTIQTARSQAARVLHQSMAELRKMQTEHQFRDYVMPEEEGYQTSELGLADWQQIRRAEKKERTLDAGARRAELDNTLTQLRHNLYPAAANFENEPNDEQPQHESEEESEETNPSARRAA